MVQLMVSNKIRVHTQRVKAALDRVTDTNEVLPLRCGNAQQRKFIDPLLPGVRQYLFPIIVKNLKIQVTVTIKQPHIA